MPRGRCPVTAEHRFVLPALNVIVWPGIGVPPVVLSVAAMLVRVTVRFGRFSFISAGSAVSTVGVLPIVIDSSFVAERVAPSESAESTTFTVNVDVPTGPVGVPLIVPPAESVRPAGRLPESSDQVRGVTPPVAVSGCEYGVPTCRWAATSS